MYKLQTTETCCYCFKLDIGCLLLVFLQTLVSAVLGVVTLFFLLDINITPISFGIIAESSSVERVLWLVLAAHIVGVVAGAVAIIGILKRATTLLKAFLYINALALLAHMIVLLISVLSRAWIWKNAGGDIFMVLFNNPLISRYTS
ncbi:hypothetical protein K7432_012920 [Basidiobolus ranarum]|uniref:Uncharacterized protein n=1 Tax=Basidiobolus ranarum TaxID=34480 RepID=A0ABR2WK30_9FUNG